MNASSSFFIDEQELERLLYNAKMNATSDAVERVLKKASKMQGLNLAETAILLTCDEQYNSKIFTIAQAVKEHIYGKRIVIFAPLYLSDYCVNQCVYCSYNANHTFNRKKLNQSELKQELNVLESMGHKRLALEFGEDDQNCSINYMVDCIQTIYQEKTEQGEIRRVNVNCAATSVENYQKLHQADIGTYILFQETYHQETYEKVHPSGPKHDYIYHTTAFDRAMQAGIDDVGAGVLFGLYNPDFEVLALLQHNQHLEETYGVGFHTVSVPRIRPAKGTTNYAFQNVSDAHFEKIVAIIRLALPFTGMILSTRESESMREKLLTLGISQISAGSFTGVGSYSKMSAAQSQFEIDDDRDMQTVLKWLLHLGYIPSFCTACYRNGRTGDRFMRLAKSGQIKNVCLPNALMTLCEYAQDYGDEEFKTATKKVVLKSEMQIQNQVIRQKTLDNIANITENKKRDLFI